MVATASLIFKLSQSPAMQVFKLNPTSLHVVNIPAPIDQITERARPHHQLPVKLCDFPASSFLGIGAIPTPPRLMLRVLTT